MRLFRLHKQEKGNILVSFLRTLGVKHTDRFSQAYFNEHPYKHTLFGLSRMLTDYGVRNIGVRIEDKTAGLSGIEPPYIAHVDSDFVIVHHADGQRAEYTWRGQRISVDRAQFNESWSGVILLPETTENSIEPDYAAHRRADIVRHSRTALAVFFFLLLAALGLFSHRLTYHTGIITALFINLVGLYVGYLLVLKQVHSHSTYADKLCSLFKYSHCNDVLQSRAAKIGGVIGWSEIGLGYFISNVCLILFFPALMPYLALINICALPYSLWSVWYQKTRARQWCPLCLTVMAVLWLLFINNAVFGLIRLPAWDIPDVLSTACIYAVPFLAVGSLVPLLAQRNRTVNLNQEINSLKANEDIFLALLKKQPRFDVDISTSGILFGDPHSPVLVSILTNPHCGPCSRMHTRVENLLDATGGKLCVQYIFSSFAPELDSSSKALIACYLNNTIEHTREIYRRWYAEGARDREAFFRRHPFDPQQREVLREFESHTAWKRKTGLNLTPTILVNGYKLPDNYKIEDLKFFTDFVLDTQ